MQKLIAPSSKILIKYINNILGKRGEIILMGRIVRNIVRSIVSKNNAAHITIPILILSLTITKIIRIITTKPTQNNNN